MIFQERVFASSALFLAMQALIRRCSQLGSQLPAVTRAAASAAVSASSSGKPAVEKEFLVYRWDPEREGQPQYQSYKIDLNA